VDIAALQEAIQRVSQLVGDHPQIAELDINPIVAFEPGKQTMALDARVVLSNETADHGEAAAHKHPTGA
jgi:succinyl-CoA synthetase beta subunit